MPINAAPQPVTHEQEMQSQLVQEDLVEYFNRQLREGMDHRVLIAGVGAAAAALVNSTCGGAYVATWFANVAARTLHLAQKQG